MNMGVRLKDDLGDVHVTCAGRDRLRPEERGADGQLEPGVVALLAAQHSFRHCEKLKCTFFDRQDFCSPINSVVATPEDPNAAEEYIFLCLWDRTSSGQAKTCAFK